MFESIEGVLKSEDFSPSDRIKLALVGLPKSGKSTTATTSEKPVFIWDLDDRKESIAGRPGVYIKTLVDIDKENPTSYQTLLTDIGSFEYDASQKKEIPKTFVLDSMTMLAEMARMYYFKYCAVGKRVISLGTSKVIMANDYAPWESEHQLMVDVMKRLSHLGHLICVFHEGPEKDPKSTQDNPVYTGRTSVYPDRLKRLVPMFNEVWHQVVDIDTGEFQLHCKPQANFLGATALYIDSKEPPNIEAMLAKHRAAAGSRILENK